MSDLPAEELSEIRLQHEAITLVGAGLETTRWALTVASFHLFNNSRILDRLRDELLAAIPNLLEMLSLTELQKLPYLSAYIEETLHLSYRVTQRSPQLSRTQPTAYGNYILPPKTEINMSIYSVTHDENVFPSSYTFNPSRWLDNPKGADGQKPLSRYMVSFGKGTRSCLGMHLAYAEIYLALASIIRRFEMTLWNTTSEDV